MWDLTSADAPHDPAKALHQTVVFNLQHLYSYAEVRRPKPRGYRYLTIHIKPDLPAARRAAAGAGVEGLFYTPDSRPLQEYLLSKQFTGSMRLEPAPQDVNGAPCRLIVASGEFGTYKIWIDPTHGCHAVRVELHQRAGDKSYGRRFPLPPPTPGAPSIIASDYEYEVTKFVQAGGRSWQVAEAHSRSTSTGDNGKNSSFDRIVKRTIKLDPDFAKLDVFKVDFPNGVEVLGIGGVPGRKIWKDGKVETQVDEQTVQGIDRSIDQIRR
jgi:hypothetical protein